MTVTDKQRKRERRGAALKTWVAKRSSRNKTMIDRWCRRMIEKAVKTDPDKDFMRDPMIDNDEGFDPDELDRFQRGETG
ncbi:MAG: hypothetical protein HRT81_08615 [Henriciella sp.]|nr:hypothetical protein [Henriciella sp.]